MAYRSLRSAELGGTERCRLQVSINKMPLPIQHFFSVLTK